MLDLPTSTKPIRKLLLQYQQIRTQSVRLCEPLEAEDMTIQPVTDVSPPKWHLGHTTWFFENFILIPLLPEYPTFDKRLHWFFNSYYESQGPRIHRSNRGNMSRPTTETILEYRAHVDRFMVQLLEGDYQLTDENLHHFTVGLQHEQQHQELLVTDIKYILGNNPLFPAYHNTLTKHSKSLPKSSFLPVKGGIYSIGFRGDGFSWDNERSAHEVLIRDFEIQNRLVTNGEYLEFIEAGGYEQYEHWLSDGWEWINQLTEKAPLYWRRQNDEWYEYTLNGLHILNPDQPVTHISYYEADAYARWKGYRLPTEQEWEVACHLYQQASTKSDNFLESNFLHPAVPQHDQDFQLMGHCWEWTASAYLPYPDYPVLKELLESTTESS
jgi:ergothioneine biosynthesis protein EgtB